MSDFYIRQSLHFTDTASLAAERGISPGFIAWVNGRRFVAVPITDRLDYPVDGVHVIAGQDNIKWIDETTGRADIEGTFPNATVAGVKNLQIVSDIEVQVPHGDVVMSVSRVAYAGVPIDQQLNPGFVTLRKSDLVIVSPGKATPIALTIPGQNITPENLTLLGLSSVESFGFEYTYIFGYLSLGSKTEYYVWAVNPTALIDPKKIFQLSVENFTADFGALDILSGGSFATNVGFADVLHVAFVIRDVTGYKLLVLEEYSNQQNIIPPPPSSIAFTTTTFVPNRNAIFIDGNTYFVGGVDSTTGNLMVSRSDSFGPTSEVDLGVTGRVVGMYVDSFGANLVVISENTDNVTRITTIGLDGWSLNNSYNLEPGVVEPIGFCLPLFNLVGGEPGINRNALHFPLLAGGPPGVNPYLIYILPAVPDSNPTPIAIISIPGSSVPVNIECPLYVDDTLLPVPYFITYTGTNTAGSFDVNTQAFNETVYSLDGYSNTSSPDLDYGKESPAQYPSKVKAGDILAAMPGSSGAQKLIFIDPMSFMTVRKSSIVITKIEARDPSAFTSTPIDLLGTPDLSLVMALNGVYDGVQYAWVAGSYNDAYSYLWKIDVNATSLTATYQLPTTLKSLQSITYSNGDVLVTALDGYDSLYKVIKSKSKQW